MMSTNRRDYLNNIGAYLAQKERASLAPKQMDSANIQQFVTAGNATIQIEDSSGLCFTYQILEKEHTGRGGPLYLVKVVTVGQFSKTYDYIGYIAHNTFIWGKRSYIRPSAPCIRLFTQFYRCLRHDCIDLFKVYHKGRCGKCNRILTTPESIRIGLGPKCRSKK